MSHLPFPLITRRSPISSPSHSSLLIPPPSSLPSPSPLLPSSLSAHLSPPLPFLFCVLLESAHCLRALRLEVEASRLALLLDAEGCILALLLDAEASLMTLRLQVDASLLELLLDALEAEG